MRRLGDGLATEKEKKKRVIEESEVSELGRTRHWPGRTRLGAAFQEPHPQ